MTQVKLRNASLALVLALAACGGGGSGTSSAPSVPSNPSTPQYAMLKLTFSTSAKSASKAAVQPQYVSPNAASLQVTVNSVNGGPPPSWVQASTTASLTTSGSSPDCTIASGTETCAVSVPAPAGNVSYTFSVLDSSSNVLGTLTTTETVVQGTNNSFSITLGGVVKTVTLSGSTLTAGTAGSETLTVAAYDASGAQIVPTAGSSAYNNPITITDLDVIGGTALELNGGSASSSVTSSSSNDVVTLTYSGAAENNVALNASGTGITGGGTIATAVSPVVFTGTTNDDASHGGLVGDTNYGQQTVFFAQASGSQTISASEVGFTPSPYNGKFDITLSPGCSSIATASAGPATSFTITASGVGVCSAKLSEHGTGYPITQHGASTSGSPTQDGTFWISVTTATFTVDGKSHH